jgi:RNA polymerase sigma-70 factor, ECF subfamily
MMALSQDAGAPGLAANPADERRARERQRVKEAQAGSVTAYEELYRENVGRVFGLCLRMAGDTNLAEELAQDVFVKVWQKLGTFRGESAFSTWLYPIAVNVALSERRARRRRDARVMVTDDLEAYEKPLRREGSEDRMDLQKALGVLPEGARAVFVLHDVEGYKHEEIGELMGVATGTSKAQLHRARRLLREALAR